MSTKLTIETMQRLAKAKGGECLSVKYVRNDSKLLWQCDKGHQWEATADSVKQGKWCPYCAGNRKLTISDMQQIAVKRGGKCLSERYVSNKAKLQWECAEGHRWDATPDSIKRGSWCPYCAGNITLTISEMQQLATAHGGKCLSTTYSNSSTKLLWECAEGHQWLSAPAHIKAGHWCPHCVGLAKGTLEEMQEVARMRGGKCLSENYVNSQARLLWECEHGHTWKAVPSQIKSGHWCPECYNQRRGTTRRLTIEAMQETAAEHGGYCLSTTYINSRTKLTWKCRDGHEWRATPNRVLQGNWCSYCAGVAKGTLEEMQQIAAERGGKCLSENYVNKQTKLLWQCADNHQWPATPSGIKRGYWCPECSSGLGERICRAFFEQLFGKKFPRSYPKWLKNQRGNQMELDGYCKSLNLAFEHHGEQHYSTRTHFITTPEALQERQDADKLKRALCIQHGIVLIEVPEIPNRLPIAEVKEFIEEQSQQFSVALPANIDTRVVNLRTAYATSNSKKILQELRTIAQEHGGRCLSDVYVDSGTRLLWECAEGHRWTAFPKAIKRGAWCKKCYHKRRGIESKLTIQEMHDLAKSRGGKCLSTVYVSSDTKLLWQCEEGHQWKARPSSVKRGGWCPICAGNTKLTLSEMHQLAAKHGGRCLSTTYSNSSTKLLWECAEGHQWLSPPSQVKAGHWCAHCAGNAKNSIEEMHVIAGERGGKCISIQYTNKKTKLLWECGKGHQWEATPSDIKNGTWCPTCAVLRRAEANRLGIEVMQQIAQERGGKCLSGTYTNKNEKLLWECAKGHQWEASPDSVKNAGHWCPHCGGTARLTIEEMQQIALMRGGRCLSTRYINDRSKLLWECAAGHQWEATPAMVKRRSWCPYCAGVVKGTIRDMQQVAQERGGNCLSKEYTNNIAKLLWECAEGHQWEAIPKVIKRGSWCPICKANSKRSVL